jgi:hypothetical protein
VDEQQTAPPAPTDQLPALAVALLKGVVYREADERLWSALLNLQSRVRDYVAVLNLELALDEAEGYAFLRSRAVDEDDTAAKMPRLVARRPLSFPVSLLLALLRKKLAEFDASGGTRLVLTRDEIVQLVAVFLPTGSNESRIVDQIETHINKVVDLGFLRILKVSSGPTGYEVRRILKAFIDAQWLAEFDIRLEHYRQQLLPNDEDSGNV